MHRTALARKHRPRRFAEIVGQDAVASTLRAAVAGDRVGHAYLFCGPRGVGKTTAARVLAMALNCPEGEDGEPCGRCESCRRIWSGQASLDVVEIDAASHRGVDDARDLRERAMYAPSSERRFKVYIIDEAHMLTRDAWNALLKILEEPPPRVIFAFATTEPQKIEQGAAPVLSRCQRFDFRRVSVPDIVRRLETVLEAEGARAEPGALLALARRADGGVRDALSLLDQVLSFTGDVVRLEDVSRMLGLVNEERYFEFFEILERGDRGEVFPYVQRLLDDGIDPAEFLRGLADALRSLLLLRTNPEAEPLDISPESRARFAAVAARFPEADLLRYLLAVGDFESSGRFRRSAQQRMQLEVLLLRLVSMDSAVELAELLAAAGAGAPDERPREAGRQARSPDPRKGGKGGGSARAGRGAEAARRKGEPSAGGGEGPFRGHDRPGPGDEAARARRTPPTPGPDGGPRPEMPPAGGGPAEETPLVRVWRRALADARGLGGAAVALRGARVEGFQDDTLRLRIPRGLADDLRAFLEDSSRSAALRERLGRMLDTPPDRLKFAVQPEGTGRRLNEEEIRKRKLSELMAMDPRLREAVEELDLTWKE